MVSNFTWAFGIIFTAIGVLGFVPGIATPDGILLGIFMVDALHNIIHLATGLIALYLITQMPGMVKTYFKVFGIVYAVVALLGLMTGSVLGLIDVNSADNALHVVVAAAALYVGFIM